ncbi:hypothetical protein KPL70_014257 [Citrus sinensis]|nr:hypothetical protein KPL70_014257 [Citrus sinensis]
MISPTAQSERVLREFCSKFTGSLRDWFESLGKYRQLQLIQTTIHIALAVIYEQFMGEPAASTEASRKEYHQMKCCSLKRHHLEMHYKRMSMLYYKLNGFNDPSLKHVFAASLPPELQRQLTTFNLDITNALIRSLAKAIRLIQHLQQSSILSDDDEVESIFLEQSEKDDHTAFILADSTDSDPDGIYVISTIQEINHIRHTLPGPSVKISVIPSKFHKPVLVIDTVPPYTSISQKFLELCPENHSHFTHPSPLWKNTQFFIHLPFKLNEDVNPTKATHPGMPPFDLTLAKQECTQLLQQDASDDFWSAILLEKIGGSESYCAHASGQFKDSEKNYHVIYKEILAVKYGIKKFEFHLISHNFLISHNSSFPKIFDFKNKLLPDKQLLNLKTWFAKYDYTVQHIKGDKNLIPDFLTRPSIKSPVLISSIQTIPIIAMYRTLPFKALTQKAFPLNLTFRTTFQIQTFAKKFLYRYFMNVHGTKPERFPSLCLEHLFLSGFTIVPSLTISEDELWYMWCLTVLFATKLVLPIRPTLRHISTPDHAPTLLWTLLEWFSPLTWWRKQLQNISNFYQLDQIPYQEANMFTSVFIVHMPYFQHPQTKDYWTQDMAYEWKTFPHPFPLDHDPTIISTLKAYLLELNNVQPVPTDIHHTSIGPSHTLEILPGTQICTPGSSSSPHVILVREQLPNYTNVLFQDAQDPWVDFQSLLQTHETQYTVTEPGSSSTPTQAQRPASPELDEDFLIY